MLAAVDVGGKIIWVIIDSFLFLSAGQGVLVGLQTLHLKSSLVYLFNFFDFGHIDFYSRLLIVAIVDFCQLLLYGFR